MTNQQTKKGPFELLEKKIVFVVSRIFFWVLCIIAGVGFVIAVILFLYNIIPPIKEGVAKPKMPPEITVSLADVQEAIKPPPPPAPKVEKPPEVAKAPETPKPTEEAKPAPPPPPPDPLKLALDAKIDTLKSYFPESLYTWATVRGRVQIRTDYWGNPIYEERIIKLGLDRHLNKVLALYDQMQQKINAVKEILGIIPVIAVNDRGKALEAWADLRTQKEKARRREIRDAEEEYESRQSVAEMKYLQAKAKKAKGLTESLRMLGAGFVGVAIIGLFLCFLAIERNTRTLQALLEKEK